MAGQSNVLNPLLQQGEFRLEKLDRHGAQICVWIRKLDRGMILKSVYYGKILLLNLCIYMTRKHFNYWFTFWWWKSLWCSIYSTRSPPKTDDIKAEWGGCHCIDLFFFLFDTVEHHLRLALFKKKTLIISEANYNWCLFFTTGQCELLPTIYDSKIIHWYFAWMCVCVCVCLLAYSEKPNQTKQKHCPFPVALLWRIWTKNK